MRFLSTIILSLSLALCLNAKDYHLLSPDKKLSASISVTDKIEFSLTYQGEQILDKSHIGIDFAGKQLSYKVRKANYRLINQQHIALVPTKHKINNELGNELKISFVGNWSLVLRLYNEGFAYRFETNFKEDSVCVTNEIAQYKFSEDNLVYWANESNPDFISHCEAFFQEKKLSEIVKEKYSYLPVSMRTSSNTRVVVTETDLFDYPNMFLFGGDSTKLTANFPNVILSYDMRTDRDVTITSKADYIAKTSGKRTYPWRVFNIGDDRSIIENNLGWMLSSSEYSDDNDWLKPGKISWEWWAMLNVYGVDFEAGVNTETYKYYIDFAAEYGLEYILMDEGWSASTLNVVKSQPGLDLQEIIKYGESKGVGVVLWTLWTPMMADMENILDTYQNWGVKGIKIDFMQMCDQNMVNFYEKVARECHKRHLLVDFHGSFKPAGLQRKYPNAMTYEGVYGMEHDKCSKDISPEHDLVLPFTRMISGPMDYTPGATINATKDDFSIRWYHPMSQGTRAHQAAIFIAFESPLTMLCDSPSNYKKNPEFTSFISQIPTVWDKTVCLKAKAGDYLILARKNGDRWFICGLNDWNARSFEISLDFLEEGLYNATIFSDGVNANMWAEDYKLSNTELDKNSKLEIKMANGGGWAAILNPCPTS